MNKATTAITNQCPDAETTDSTRSNWRLKMYPGETNRMANAREPAAFNLKKRNRDTPPIPARGDATTFIPVTNFDTINVQVPRRENTLRVRPMQLSGSSEI